MPKGPLGGPRPGASASLNIKMEMNAPNGEAEAKEMIIDGITRRFGKVDNITITEETEKIPNTESLLDKVVIDILLDKNKAQLIEVNDLVNDVEEALDTTRVSVTIEAI